MRDKYLNHTEVADYMGVDAATVRHWFRSGQIEGHRINGRLRVRRSWLKESYPNDRPREKSLDLEDLEDRWRFLQIYFDRHAGKATLPELIEDLAFIEEVFPCYWEDHVDHRDADDASNAVNSLARDLRHLLENVAGWRYVSRSDEGTVKWAKTEFGQPGPD